MSVERDRSCQHIWRTARHCRQAEYTTMSIDYNKIILHEVMNRQTRPVTHGVCSTVESIRCIGLI